MLIPSVSGYFYGFHNAASIFSFFFFSRSSFSAAGDHGLLFASLSYRHEVVSTSGLGGKTKEQEQAMKDITSCTE